MRGEVATVPTCHPCMAPECVHDCVHCMAEHPIPAFVTFLDTVPIAASTLLGRIYAIFSILALGICVYLPARKDQTLMSGEEAYLFFPGVFTEVEVRTSLLPFFHSNLLRPCLHGDDFEQGACHAKYGHVP